MMSDTDLGRWLMGHLDQTVEIDVRAGGLAVYVSGRLTRADVDAAGERIATFLVSGDKPAVVPPAETHYKIGNTHLELAGAHGLSVDAIGGRGLSATGRDLQIILRAAGEDG